MFTKFFPARRYKKKGRRIFNSVCVDDIASAAPTVSNDVLGPPPYRIAFVIPGMPKYSGGHTSILRIGTSLSNAGNEVYYVTNDLSSVEEMKSNAAFNLPTYKGIFLEKASLGNQVYDIGIATLWTTCYTIAANTEVFRYKAYFVQDFEPYFYPMGDLYYLSLNSYRMGFHIISLGGWNKKVIEEKLPGVQADAIDFPVALEHYPIVSRDIVFGDEVVIGAYVKEDPKRGPLLVSQQLLRTARDLELRGKKASIIFFGLDRRIPVPFGVNAGKLSHAELRALYQKLHFGVVASLTNISLVNYEMLAQGVAVVDYVEGSAPSFFSSKEMIFAGSGIDSLSTSIMHYLDHPAELAELVKRGQTRLRSLSWDESAAQFARCLGRRNSTVEVVNSEAEL